MRTRRVTAALVAAASLLGAGLPLASDRAHAAPPGDDEVIAFAVRGTGLGHGRGMSQWGAYGRAIAGQSWQQILDAYYGETSAGSRSQPNLRVRLLGWDGAGTLGVVARAGKAAWNGSAASYLSLYAVETSPDRFSVFGLTGAWACPGGGDPGIVVPQGPLSFGDSGSAVLQMQTVLAQLGFDPGDIDGHFGPNTEAAVKAFQTAHSPPDDGVWAADEAAAAEVLLGDTGGPWQLLGSNVAGPIRFTSTVSQSGAAPGDALGVCQSSGALTHYRGSVELVHTTAGNRVVNQLDVENYLRGVVPREVAASWGDAAGGAGMNALRAQSVAARSYGMSQNRYAYAQTCDSSSCQVYAGAATRVSATADVSTAIEHPNTNQAIADTAGVVRLRAGAIVSTEFSASNGPRTAGGAFPPIDDPFDDVPGNPNHRWTRIIDADDLRSTYGLSSANGVLTEPDPISVLDGIWANRVDLGDGRTITAWNFRNTFGLPAPGFELVPIRRELSDVGSFAFIGDSVGEGVVECCGAAFLDVTEGVFSSEMFDAVGGRRTVGGSDDGVAAAGRVPVGTGLVMVELGYNDDPDDMSANIDAVMSVLRNRDVGVVAWVNVSERRTTTDYATTNAALDAATDRWPELVVLDWNAASDHGDANRWFSDGVHQTATGRAEFAWWLRDSALWILGDGFVPPRRLRPDLPLRIPVTGVAGVPVEGVSGVALNVTAVDPVDRGWLRVWMCDDEEPVTASVNYSAGGVVPNAVVVPVGESGEVCVSTRVETDVVVDLSAWFDAGVQGTAGGRIADTRDTERVTPGEPLRVKVTGVAGVPEPGVPEAGGDEMIVTGVALNVTAVDPVDRGWLRVWRCDDDEPETASVNYPAGGVVPNAVMVPIGESGEVCVSTRVETDVVVDLTAWFDGGLQSTDAARLADTRDTTRLEPGEPLRVPVTGVAGVPVEGVSGVALNVTAVDPVDRGWLRVWMCDDEEPVTASVNYSAGGVVPNAVVVPVGESGEVCVSTRVETDVVVDLSAWFDAGLQPTVAERLVDTRFGLGPIPDR